MASRVRGGRRDAQESAESDARSARAWRLCPYACGLRRPGLRPPVSPPRLHVTRLVLVSAALSFAVPSLAQPAARRSPPAARRAQARAARTGVASYYAASLHGRRTASGERYNRRAPDGRPPLAAVRDAPPRDRRRAAGAACWCASTTAGRSSAAANSTCQAPPPTGWRCAAAGRPASRSRSSTRTRCRAARPRRRAKSGTSSAPLADGPAEASCRRPATYRTTVTVWPDCTRPSTASRAT